MKDGFLRAAAVSPLGAVADIAFNARQIKETLDTLAKQQCAVVTFPGLFLTGCSCGDLFRQQLLLQQSESALEGLLRETRDLDTVYAVGLPVPFQDRLYHCAALCHRGKLLGLSAKASFSGSSDSQEERYFSPGPRAAPIHFAGQDSRIGRNLLFPCTNLPELVLAVLPGEDLLSPHRGLWRSGASLLLIPAAHCELVGQAERRRAFLRTQTRRIPAAALYADANAGESTTDLVFAGHCLVGEMGRLLSEAPPFAPPEQGIAMAETDLERIRLERLRTGFPNGPRQIPFEGERRPGNAPEAEGDSSAFFSIPFSFGQKTMDAFQPTRSFPPFPFLPIEKPEENLRRILDIQATGLSVRLRRIGCQTALLGLSGGLDSTLALLVTLRAFEQLSLPPANIHGFSMPCFGTSGRTRGNAQRLAELLGIRFREIPITDAVLQHFADIGQDPAHQDTAYENAQARERTQVLMDLANRLEGIVVGTGDLSELALGFATYNGDHMSMYSVNADIPKTLVRALVRHVAEDRSYRPEISPERRKILSEILLDILDTPVSPELLPPKEGEIRQRTEDLVGPYPLHDFFLYYMVRCGFGPGKIYRMACRSFSDSYPPAVIKKWLTLFYRRFFTQQFKRSCLPDGPKVGSVSLSPRGDFRMPSDASLHLWRKELESL